MRKTESVELTTICLIYQDNKILLQNRKKEDWKGYTLPGGHVEEGESIVSAVIREMKEETGLDIINPQLCGIKQFPIDGGRYIVFLFKTNEFIGDVISSSEGEMKWIHRKNLPSYPIVEDLEELLQVMESDNLTEFQYTIEEDDWKVNLW